MVLLQNYNNAHQFRMHSTLLKKSDLKLSNRHAAIPVAGSLVTTITGNLQEMEDMLHFEVFK